MHEKEFQKRILKSKLPIFPNKFGSGFGYENATEELKCVMSYNQEVAENFKSPGESRKLYDHAQTVLKPLLSKVQRLINFGVSYAYIDSLLAIQFKNVEFIGIDRSKFTKMYNEHCFNIENLKFVAGDIFDFLEDRTSTDDIFFHTRTLALLPKSFITKLYTKVQESNFKYIVGMEQIGISRQTGKPYEFSLDDQDSVIYRGPMFIHNYPWLLSQAGYKILNIELVKTDHSHLDYRILSFVAKRESSK